MTTARPFQFVVLRYVADIVRDEPVNVGALVLDAEESKADFRFLDRSTLGRRVASEPQRRLITQFERQLLNAISLGTTFPRFGKVTSPGFLQKARSEFVGSLQLSEPRGIMAQDIKQATSEVFRTYVAEKKDATVASGSIAPSRLRQRLWSAFTKGHLLQSGTAKDGVQKNFVVEGQHAKWTFDVGYRNGSLSLINSVALNSGRTETNLSRALVLQGMAQEVRKTDVLARFSAVVAPPRGAKGHGYNEAVEILADSQIDVFPASDVGKLVEKVRMQLNLLDG